MALLAKGKEVAFNELYERYAESLYRFFYKMLYQDETIASDFCQNLFMKIFEKSDTYNSNFKFSTWIYSMASNMCKNEYRRISRKSPTIQLDKVVSIAEPKAPQKIDEDIFQSHLQQAVNKLDEKHKLCFVLRHQEHNSIREISQLLDCPQGTVKSRLHSTLKKLASELYLFDPNKTSVRDIK